jgi:Cu2+-exporting ATPase
LQVESVVQLAARSVDACLAIAAALERGSEHPVARAIVARAAGIPALEVGDVRVAPGAGIAGRVGGVPCRIGSPAYCGDADDIGASAVVLIEAEAPIARFTLTDLVRPDAEAVVAALRRSGKTVHLLSGDAADAVDRVGQALEIQVRRSRATPEDKLAYVRSLQERGAVVAMIGDGINDAPVLAQADVSVAMASGAHLAQARADAVLVSNRLADLGTAFDLSRRAMRIVRENLAWATLYNLIAIPAAMAGWVNPWLAGIGMSGSSLAVVLNALRLRRAPRNEAR